LRSKQKKSRALKISKATGRALRECGGWCGQPPLPLKYVRICSKTFTILEMARELGVVSAAATSDSISFLVSVFKQIRTHFKGSRG